MKKSKRILASVMSALLVLPSLALPFSGAAAVEGYDDQRIVAVVQEEVSTNVSKHGYMGKGWTLPEAVELTKGASNYMIVGQYKLEQTFYDTVDWMEKSLSSGNIMIKDTAKVEDDETGNYFNNYNMSRAIPVPSRVNGEWMNFEIPLAAYTGTDIKRIELNPYAKLPEYDPNRTEEDPITYSIQKVYVIDVSILPDGSPNPVVATYYGGNEVITDYQGSRKWENGKWNNSNTMSHFGFGSNQNVPSPYTVELDNLANLQVEFDVMVENADNHEKFDASKFNGFLRLKVGDKQVDYGYGWNNFVKVAGEWAHVTVPLADIYSDDRVLTSGGALGNLQMFAYDENDLREDPNAAGEADGTSTQTRFAHAICHTKNVCLVDTSLIREEVDRTALTKAIADAKAKLADGKTYTEASLAALNEKLAAAEAVPQDADQAAVTAAAEALQAAIAGLVEETTPAPEVPDNWHLVSKEEVTSSEGHGLEVIVTPATALDLADYAGHDLSLTFKMKVNKLDTLPEALKTAMSGKADTEWLAYLKNGETNISDVKVLGSQTVGSGAYGAVTKADEWADVTVAIPSSITSVSKLRVQFWNDLHQWMKAVDAENADSYTEAEYGSKGVTISVKDVYVVVGDVSPVMRWSQQERTLTDLNGGYQFYFDWKAADGVSGQDSTEPGVDLSDNTTENVANPDYALHMDITYNVLKALPEGVTPVAMMGQPIINLRSSKKDGKEMATSWFTIPAEYCTAKEDGTGYAVSIPLTAITTSNLDWADAKEILIRQEIKDESDYRTGGYISMALSNVKVVEKEAPVVNRAALEEAISDAEAKLADGKTYTEATLAALNEKLTAAKNVAADADQATVTKAAEDLQAAIAGLVEETQSTVDYTALNKAIEDAKAKLADGKTYTEASLAALNEKLAAAEALKTSTDQAAVTAAAEALQAAIAGLVEETQPPVDPSKVPLITEELTSPVQHYMNVYKAFETPVDLTGYAGRELTISFKLRVNKDEATFPASITQEPATWIKNIVNGTMILWGGSATDDSGKVNMADNLGVAYKMNCGEVGNLLEKIVLGEYIEVTMPVPQAVIDKGSLAKLEIFLYNDLHKLTNVESDQNAGVTISVKDAYLNVGEAQGSKSELKTLLDGKKSAAELAGYTTESVDSYNKLFEDAQAVYDDPDATVAAIASAIASLEAADSVLVPLADNTVMRWSGSEVTKTDMLYGTMFYYDWTPADGVPGSNSSDPGVDLSGKASNGANADYSFTAKVTFNPLEGTTAEQISSMWKVLRFRLRSTTIDGAEKATAFYELTPVDFDGANSFVVNIPLSMFSGADIDWKNTKDLIVQCEMNDDYKLAEAGPNPHFTMTLSDVKVVNNGVVPPETEKTALKKLIAAAEGLRADLATAGAEEFETALEAARGVVANNNATQADVDEAIADLEAAIEGLVIPWGDLNGKDGVTAEDALLALQAATDKVQLTEDQKYLADVNGDGEVSAEDALLLLQYATQKITTFPVQDLAD